MYSYWHCPNIVNYITFLYFSYIIYLLVWTLLIIHSHHPATIYPWSPYKYCSVSWLCLGLISLPFMAAPVSYPTNYQLSHQVSGYMRRHFCSLAFPDSGTAAPQIPLNLPVDLSVGMHQMVATLVTAYNYCSMPPPCPFPRVLIFVQLTVVLTSSGLLNHWHPWSLGPSRIGSKPSLTSSLLLFQVLSMNQWWFWGRGEL